MNSRRALNLGSLALSGALAVACSGSKPLDAGATAGTGGDGAGGRSSGGGGGPEAVAGQAASGSETGGASGSGSSAAAAGGGGDSTSGGRASTGGDASFGGDTSAGGDNAGSAGSEPMPSGDAGAAGAGAAPTLIQNSGFELGSLVGWKLVVTPSSAGKSVYAQYPVGDAKAVDGTWEVAFWNGTSAFTGDLEQTITGLTPGTYELKVHVAFGTGINAAYLYAINCGLSNARVDLPIADTVPTFTEFVVPNIEVTGDSCTIGLFADMKTGDWLNADAFVFEPVAPG